MYCLLSGAQGPPGLPPTGRWTMNAPHYYYTIMRMPAQRLAEVLGTLSHAQLNNTF